MLRAIPPILQYVVVVWYLIKHEDNFTDCPVYVEALRLASTNANSPYFIPVILPVVFCGCKTWTLTFREEQGVENILSVDTGRGWSPEKAA
jgi:hypothetical protein